MDYFNLALPLNVRLSVTTSEGAMSRPIFGKTTLFGKKVALLRQSPFRLVR